MPSDVETMSKNYEYNEMSKCWYDTLNSKTTLNILLSVS